MNMRFKMKFTIFAGLVTFAIAICVQTEALAAETEWARLSASMKPSEIKELVTKNCNHDLFKMWYDWEEDDIKKYGSQRMFNIICWNNDMKWDPVTRQVLVINAFILSMVWNPAEADDVLQETNLVLWEKAAEFDGSRPFLPWAMRFAQFQAMAWLKRRQQQQQRLAFDDELVKLLAEEAAEEPVFEARWHALASCLQKLRSEQRALIARRYQPDASVNAMAEAAGTTPKAVSDKLRRIRRALLDCIQQTLAEESFA